MWTSLVELVTPYAPDGKKGRPPFPGATTMLIGKSIAGVRALVASTSRCR